MNIHIVSSVDDAEKARGLAVVIDVFRAFTTEAYIFANGAEKIIPVRDLDEAYALQKKNPEYVLVGEREGIKPFGFDFGNGPSEVLNVDFFGKTIVHTTSNGTKGLLNAIHADEILVGSFVIAKSIIKYIQNKKYQEVYLIATAPDTEKDNEDILLAYYIRDVLENKEVNEDAIKSELRTTSAASFLLEEAGVPQSDIDLCLDFHRFNFVIKKVYDGGRFYLVQEKVS